MPLPPKILWSRISKAEAAERGLGYYFDQAKADFAVGFFERFLIHSKGKFAGQPFTLLDWQRVDVIEELFGWMRMSDDTRRFRIGYIEIPKKNGKALSLDTPIPTPGGWATMASLSVGDEVFDDTGSVCRVVAATEVMADRPCYEVEFDDGCKIVADASHEWLSHCHSEEQSRVFTTAEMAAKPKCGNANNFSVRVAGGLSPPDVDLPIDPYLLGLWLGDGNSRDARITVGKSDSCIVGLMEDCGHGVVVKERSSCLAARVPGMQQRLRKCGLIGDKHIPKAYLRASIQQRTMLMQGLMDSDGYAAKSGQCEFTSISEKLRDGFLELARSLGFKPSCRTHASKLYGRVVGVRHRVFFNAFAGDVVFKLPRKQARLPPRSGRKQRSLSRTIVSIRPVASVPVRCIQVDSKSRLFLAGESMIPTHNSTLLSGIGALLTAADGEPAAEVYVCATSRDQAGIIYRQLAELVKASPALDELLEVVDSRKTITCVPTNSFCRVISSDSARAEGLNIHGLLYDELHAAKDRKLWDAVRYGGASRSQPMILSITTAGADKASICWEQHEYALKVQADPSVDPSFFPYVRGAAIDDDYTSEEVWRAANPSFGVTMDAESFRGDVAEAQRSNSKLSSFLRYRLDIWSSGENRFIDPVKWAQCTGMSGGFDQRAVWYGGLDLAQTWDCNAFVAVCKAADGVFDVVCKYWIPGDNAHERSVKEGVPWERWAEDPAQGVCLTPGNTVDYEFIKRDILNFCKGRTVRKIAVDPHNSHYLVQQLQAEGLDVIGFSQTPQSMNTPTKNLDNLIINGRLRTSDNKVLTWMAENAAVIENASGHLKVAKPSPKSHARVDGIIALIMALALSADAENAPPTPEPEILVL